MRRRVFTLRFRAVNRGIFDAIKSGRKKVETRAATKRYQSIVYGDILRMVCEKSEFKKKVLAVKKFRSIRAMLNKYKPADINPDCKTASELEKIYYSFPGYREKTKKYGLVVLELK